MRSRIVQWTIDNCRQLELNTLCQYQTQSLSATIYKHVEVLTFNELLQLVPDRLASQWVWPAGQCVIPGRADWGQQSESSTLRTSGPAILEWTAIIVNLKVSLIQLQERPHQHCLQHLHWKTTQIRLQLPHQLDFSHCSADTNFIHLSLYTKYSVVYTVVLHIICIV